MVWLLVWAGLLIIVLYSPIGSPGFYSSKSYIIDYQNFVPTKVALLNSSKINLSSNLNSDEPDLPDVSLATKSNYSIGNYQSIHISYQGSSYSTLQNQSSRGSNSISGGQNGSGTSLLAGRSLTNSAGTQGIVMTNGITTVSSISNTNNSTAKQNLASDNPVGGTDPGGDPGGDPIPVGEGWELFFIFGTVYAMSKTKYVETLLQKIKKN